MSRYDVWKTVNPPEYDECEDEYDGTILGKTKYFADGSTIFTHANTENCTVIGKMAHEYYFKMLRKECGE